MTCTQELAELDRLLGRYEHFDGDVGKPTMRRIIELLITQCEGALQRDGNGYTTNKD